MDKYHKKNLKADILNCSIQMIITEGYQSVSIRKIASELHVSPTSIYRHYTNLEDLFKQGLIVFGEKLSFSMSYSEDKTPIQNLETMGINFITFAIEHKNEFEFMFLSEYSFKNVSVIQNKDLPLVSLMISTIKKLEHINKNEQILFNQLWSFILGYGILISKEALDFNEELVKITLQDFLK